MKKVFKIKLLVVALLLTFTFVLRFTGEPVQASGPMYKIVKSPRSTKHAAYEAILNDMDSKGWEFDKWHNAGGTKYPDLIFKRK